MSNFLSQLTPRARARLLEELNYMNLEEIRGFCSERRIPDLTDLKHSPHFKFAVGCTFHP